MNEKSCVPQERAEEGLLSSAERIITILDGCIATEQRIGYKLFGPSPDGSPISGERPQEDSFERKLDVIVTKLIILAKSLECLNEKI
ncbi:MAG: hypothetical protein PHE79_08495 [Eubacteriales bacterium]|nr:hypothetical protein [Eubacteriales bacterium]